MWAASSPERRVRRCHRARGTSRGPTMGRGGAPDHDVRDRPGGRGELSAAGSCLRRQYDRQRRLSRVLRRARIRAAGGGPDRGDGDVRAGRVPRWPAQQAPRREATALARWRLRRPGRRAHTDGTAARHRRPAPRGAAVAGDHRPAGRLLRSPERDGASAGSPGSHDDGAHPKRRSACSWAGSSPPAATGTITTCTADPSGYGTRSPRPVSSRASRIAMSSGSLSPGSP